MIFLFVPETKQRTLEELDYVFAVPTRTHMRYQVTKALPYFVRRWVLCDKRATLEPLYHFGPEPAQHGGRRAVEGEREYAEKGEKEEIDEVEKA